MLRSRAPDATAYEALMSDIFSQDDLVNHFPQRPSGRVGSPYLGSYTIVRKMPIEADGRVRYRIKSMDGKI